MLEVNARRPRRRDEPHRVRAHHQRRAARLDDHVLRAAGGGPARASARTASSRCRSRTRPRHVTPTGSASRSRDRDPPASSRSRSSCAIRRPGDRPLQLRHPPGRGQPDRRPAPHRRRAASRWRGSGTIAASPSTTASAAPSSSLRGVARARRPARVTSPRSTALIGDVPVTLVPDPETLAGALALTGERRPRPPSSRACGTRPATSSTVLAGPYTTVDGPAPPRPARRRRWAPELAQGRETLEQGLDAAVDHTHRRAAAARRRDARPPAGRAGTTRLVVDPVHALSDAEPADQFTPARPFRLDSAAGSFDALEVNRTTLVRCSSGPGRTRSAPQQVLAGLAVVALEQPNRSRGVVIDTPTLWDARPGRVGRRPRRPRATTRCSPARGSPTSSTPSRPRPSAASPTCGASLPRRRARRLSTPAGYRRARTQVDALASMIGADDPLVAEGPPRARPDAGERRAPHRPGGQHGAPRRPSRSDVATVTSRIIAPPSRTFTLTSRRAIGARSASRTARSSGSGCGSGSTSQKLEFPEGAERIVVLPPGNTTTQFDVESRASGTFPVLVTVSSPDGGLALQRSRYTVRSTFVSGVGVFLDDRGRASSSPSGGSPTGGGAAAPARSGLATRRDASRTR